jgi:hypothetical protein
MKNAIHDALIITKRQILQLARVPELLVFSTIQPVLCLCCCSVMYLVAQSIRANLADMYSY